MKKIQLTLLFCALCVIVYTQNINEEFDLGNANKISITADYPSITFHSHSSSQLKVEGMITSNGIPVQDVVKFDWNPSDNQLTIKTNIDKRKKISQKERDAKIDQMSEAELRKILKGHGGSDYSINNNNLNMSLDIYLPASISTLKVNSTYGSIDIEKITADTDIFNTYGSITASANSSFKNCFLESTYSTVTLNISEQERSDIRLQSNYGEIFTDLDFEIDKDESTHQRYKTIIIGALNDGGKKSVKLRSDYSNVYLKKE